MLNRKVISSALMAVFGGMGLAASHQEPARPLRKRISTVSRSEPKTERFRYGGFGMKFLGMSKKVKSVAQHKREAAKRKAKARRTSNRK